MTSSMYFGMALLKSSMGKTATVHKVSGATVRPQWRARALQPYGLKLYEFEHVEGLALHKFCWGSFTFGARDLPKLRGVREATRGCQMRRWNGARAECDSANGQGELRQSQEKVGLGFGYFHHCNDELGLVAFPRGVNVIQLAIIHGFSSLALSLIADVETLRSSSMATAQQRPIRPIMTSL